MPMPMPMPMPFPFELNPPEYKYGRTSHQLYVEPVSLQVGIFTLYYSSFS